VLVSAGVVPLAHAGDGGGSIRIPAACCGLVGLKPTRGRLDIEGSPLLPINLAAHGVVSRTVRDTIAFFTAVEATTPSERPPITPVPPAPPAPLRIGLSTTSPAGTPVDDAQRRAVEQAGRLCESLGHHVEPIASPIDEAFPRDFFHFWSLLAVIQTRTIHLVARGRFDTSQWDPWTLHMAGRFRETSREVLAATLRLRAFGARFRRVFSRFDVVVMPTTAHAPPPLGHLAPTVPFETARARLRQFVPFTSAFNASGCPALSLPLGRDALGLPVGVQLGADLDGERSLLSLALTLEAAAPWPRRAPLPEAVSGAPVG
jgi:amidase